MVLIAVILRWVPFIMCTLASSLQCKSLLPFVSTAAEHLQQQAHCYAATCLDLALAGRAMRRLVHRQQHHLVVAGQHLAVEPAVNGANILIRELSEVVEACR